MVETNGRLIINAIKDWMKKNAGKPVPSYREITEGLNLTGNLLTSYTHFKKQAFKELEQAGFKLEYTNDLKTVAFVDGYTPPEGIGAKVAEKILGIESSDGEQEPEAEPERKQEKKFDSKPDLKERRPSVLLYIHETGMDVKCLEGIGTSISGLGGLPKGTKVNVQIQVKEA
jgi:hypothetical protein